MFFIFTFDHTVIQTITSTLPFPSLVLALRSGGAGAAGGAAGVGAGAGAGAGADAGAGAGEAAASSPASVPATTMFSTAAATLAAARAALAVAEPYMRRHSEKLYSSALYCQTQIGPVQVYRTLRGLLVLNSLHLAIISVIILDTAILGFLAAIKGLRK